MVLHDALEGCWHCHPEGRKKNRVKTFYIAGPSRMRGEIARLYSELRSLGLQPWNGHDWTQADRASAANMVSKNMLSAVNADIFVLLLSADFTTAGGWTDYGARISHFKAAHVVTCGVTGPMVLEHGHTTRHEDWAAFRTWLLRHLGLSDGLVRLEKTDDQIDPEFYRRGAPERMLPGMVEEGITLEPMTGDSPRLDSGDYRARLLEEFPIKDGATGIGERLPPGYIGEKLGTVLPQTNVGQISVEGEGNARLNLGVNPHVSPVVPIDSTGSRDDSSIIDLS